MQQQINFSADFISILNQIKDASTVARRLLDLSMDSSAHAIKDDCIDYIALSNDDAAMLSYLTPERIEYLKSTTQDFQFEVWNSKRRYRARPAAVVTKILDSISGRDIEIFNNLFKSALGLTKFEFMVVSGYDIRHWYHYSNAENSGSLGASCMKHDFCQDLLGIYVDNPDIIKMLVMIDYKKKLIGRALLWETEEAKVMDRIYTANDEELSYHFKLWAQKNGYIYKTAQKWNNTLFFEEAGKTAKRHFAVKLKRWRYSKFPYLDTFKFLDYTNGIICNHKFENTERILIGSDGGWLQPETLQEDFFDSLYYHRSELVPIVYDADTLKLRENEVFTHQSNTVWSETNSMYIKKGDSVHIDFLGDNFFKAELNCFNKSDAIREYLRHIVSSDFTNFIRLLARKQSIQQILEEKNSLKKRWQSDSTWVNSVVNETYEDIFSSISER